MAGQLGEQFVERLPLGRREWGEELVGGAPADLLGGLDPVPAGGKEVDFDSATVDRMRHPPHQRHRLEVVDQ
jgi:hypothetical protein